MPFHNLITGDQLFTRGEMKARSMAALELLQALKNDPDCEDIGTYIDQTIEKISTNWGLNT